MNPGPDELRALLAARDPAEKDRAWTEFLERHSDLIIRVARHMGGGHDLVMDRYAYVLEALARDDWRRLRSYLDDGSGRFETWLIVVVRRMCLDHHRHRYGRRQADSRASAEHQAERRKLVDLIGDELSLSGLAASSSEDPDLGVREGEVHAALTAALQELAVPDRLLLRLRFEEDLSVPEIARATSARSPFHLYRRIDALLKQLEAKLRSAGFDEAMP